VPGQYAFTVTIEGRGGGSLWATQGGALAFVIEPFETTTYTLVVTGPMGTESVGSRPPPIALGAPRSVHAAPSVADSGSDPALYGLLSLLVLVPVAGVLVWRLAKPPASKSRHEVILQDVFVQTPVSLDTPPRPVPAVGPELLSGESATQLTSAVH